MKGKDESRLGARVLRAIPAQGTPPTVYRRKQVIYSQGDPAGAVCYVHTGRVKLRVVSAQGKEAVIGLLGPGEFFGEGCLAGQPLRTTSAVALSNCSILWLEKAETTRALRKQPRFASVFLAHLLSRNIRLKEDLLDQLFHSSEQRLARALLLLASLDDASQADRASVKLSQETLASMVGTTRSRVSFFMNKFRRQGLIDYRRGLTVRRSLRRIIPQD
jgi:CRP/FNR family transcriptional regulator, cyclic AMP receptor protein